MRILGIDPGLHLAGYGCVDLSPGRLEPTLVEAGVFRLRSKASLAYRLGQLHDDLEQVLDELRPHRMVVEQLSRIRAMPAPRSCSVTPAAWCSWRPSGAAFPSTRSCPRP